MNTLSQDFWNELALEAAVTRRYLAAVPFENADFRPHQQSEKLGRLAIHVAEIMAWWKAILTDDELDFIDFEPENITENDALLAFFDNLLAEAKTALKGANEEEFARNWSMRHGDEVYFTVSKKQALRIFALNHLVHHRAQLGVYLRMLNIVVPATYGPSADDYDVILADNF